MSGPDDASWQDPRHRELLLHILRTRPSSLADLSATGPEDAGDAGELVRTLHDAGFLELDGGGVTAIPPEAAVANIANAELLRQRRSLEALARLVRQLPTLSRAWDMGETPDDYEVRGEVIEGDAQAMQRWFSVTQQRPPLNPGTAYGDFSYIQTQVMPNLEATQAAFEQGGYQLRLLVPADQLGDEANREMCDVMVRIGLEVRVAASVPTWLYVDSGVMAGIPMKWGAPSPNGFVLVYDVALIEAVGWLFERWWAMATPWPLEGAGWVPVMRLLARGRTDEQIAADLGMGVRTVRRRIAEAMDHFSTSSRFELGMHWARRTQQTNRVALDLDMGQLSVRPPVFPVQAEEPHANR